MLNVIQLLKEDNVSSREKNFKKGLKVNPKEIYLKFRFHFPLKFTFHFEFWGQPSLIWLLTFPTVISNTPYFDSTAKQYFLLETNETHCVEGVCIRRFCGPCFPTFGLNTDGYSVNLCIYYKYLKIRTIKAPNINRFYRAKVNISLKLLID